MEHSITIAIAGSFSFSWEKTSLTSFHFIMILSDIIIIVIPSMTFNKLIVFFCTYDSFVNLKADNSNLFFDK